jgi:hypothetical protein
VGGEHQDEQEAIDRGAARRLVFDWALDAIDLAARLIGGVHVGQKVGVTSAVTGVRLTLRRVQKESSR